MTSLITSEDAKHPANVARSTHWPAVRAAYLKEHPTCAVCGGKEKLEVHHRRPFHLHPELELDPTNFITLCESDKNGCNCHLMFGHIGNFKSYNIAVESDANYWHNQLLTRPKGTFE
jgi:hypothetical protein